MAEQTEGALQEHQASHVISALHACAKGAAIAAIAVGVVEIIVWAVKVSVSKTVHAVEAEIGIGMALAFALSGLSLWLRRSEHTSKRSRFWADASAIAVLLLGLIILLRYAVQRDFTIGELLYRGVVGVSGTPSSALLFALLGLGLLLLDVNDRRGRWPAQSLLVFGGLFALTALFGFLFSALAPKKGAEYSPAILPAAVTFVVLFFGALCSRPHRGIVRALTADAIGSDVARRLLPAAIVVPPVLCLLCYFGYYAKWYEVGFGLALLTTLNSAALSAVLLRTADALNQTDSQRRTTEKQKNELNEALHQANAFREKVMDSAVFVVIALDLEGRFTLANQRMSELTGYAIEDLIGQPFTMLSPGGSHDTVITHLRQALEEGAPVYHVE